MLLTLFYFGEIIGIHIEITVSKWEERDSHMSRSDKFTNVRCIVV